MTEQNNNFPDISKTWPNLKITERIGGGAFGTVYKAVHKAEVVAGDAAAIKVIRIPSDISEIEGHRLEGFSDEDIRRNYEELRDEYVNEIRFMMEFRDNPNVARIEDYDVVPNENEFGWTIYIRMELLSDLRVFAQNNDINAHEVIKIGKDICNALKICESRKVLHRDIKPSNILVSPKTNSYKLSDFGIAKHSDGLQRSMSTKGTPDFMAPEVYRSGSYDWRVDIYSLGMVLYYYMNRKHGPFLDLSRQPTGSDKDSANWNRFQGTPLPAPADAAPPLAEVILHACEPDPERRFRSAQEFYDALCQLEAGTYRVGSYVQSNSVLQEEKTYHPAYDDPRTMKARQPQPMPAPAQSVPAVQKPAAAKKKKSALPVVLTVVAIIAALAGAGVFAAVKLLNRDTGEEKNTRHTTEETTAETTETVKPTETEKETGPRENALAEAREKAGYGDYYSAMKLVKETLTKFPGDEELEQAYAEYRDKYRDQLLATASSRADSGDLKGAIETVRAGLDNMLSEELSDALKKYEDKYRETKIGEAKNYADKDDLLNAITVLTDASSVLKTDAEINNLLAEYQARNDESVYSKASALVNDGKYDDAIKLLSENRDVLSDTDKCDSTIAGYKDAAVNNLLKTKKVSTLVSKNKFTEAFAALEAIGEKYPDSAVYIKTTEDTKAKYVTYELEIINAYIKKYDYESASNECEKALEIVPAQEDIISKRDYAQEMISKEQNPVPLMNYYVSDQTNSCSYTAIDNRYGSIKDIFGNEYANVGDGFYFYTYDTWGCTNKTGYAEFRVNKQFSMLKLSAVVFHHSLSSEAKVEMNIYGDDKLLISKKITNRTAPDNIFRVDISNVEWIRIEFKIYDSGLNHVGVIKPMLISK